MPPRRDPVESFWERVQKTETCWLWTGAYFPTGYGQLATRRKGEIYAHRFAYKLLVGPIPEGLEIDHLCENEGCVNPAHLEVVPHSVNIARSAKNPCAINGRKTHCKRGHSLSGENLTVLPDGHRVCVTCRRMRDAEFRERHRERRNAYFRARRAALRS